MVHRNTGHMPLPAFDVLESRPNQHLMNIPSLRSRHRAWQRVNRCNRALQPLRLPALVLNAELKLPGKIDGIQGRGWKSFRELPGWGFRCL